MTFVGTDLSFRTRNGVDRHSDFKPKRSDMSLSLDDVVVVVVVDVDEDEDCWSLERLREDAVPCSSDVNVLNAVEKMSTLDSSRTSKTEYCPLITVSGHTMRA